MSWSHSESNQNHSCVSWSNCIFDNSHQVSKQFINQFRVNLQKKEDSNISVLMRIMTNYLQILAAAMSFNLHFPSYMTNALSGAKQVGNSSGVLLSFDWLLMESDLSSSFGNIAFLKVTMIALIPIAFLSAAALGLGLVFIKNRVKFKRYLWVTAITVFFLLHPTLTQYCLRIFKCNDIGNGQSRVEMDIQTPCWDPHHLKWVYFLGKQDFKLSNFIFSNYWSLSN